MRAAEAAVGVQIPKNARIIRNMMHAAQFQHDHLVHFYHLHALDWVDLKSALEATPAVTEEMALAANRDAPVINFSAVQDRLQEIHDSLLDAYLRRDLAALLRAHEEQVSGGGEALARRLRERFIDARNRACT